MAHAIGNDNPEIMDAQEESFDDLLQIISNNRYAPEPSARRMSPIFPSSASLPVMPSHMQLPTAPLLPTSGGAAVPAAAAAVPVMPDPIVKPYIRIVEEPSNRRNRFRYKCEGRTASSIAGMSSDMGMKTFPTIEIVGCTGPVVVIVSCVTRDKPYRQHPHWLVSKDENNCKMGVYTVKLPPDQRRLEMQKVGIQCVKKADVAESLEKRQQMNVDPFQAGFDHKDSLVGMNLYELRLCYQAFLTDSQGKTIPLDPIVSAPIFGKSKELNITRLCSCAAKVGGGDEIIMLCDKVTKDDIQIRFFETNEANVEVWQDFAKFQQTDVHKQTAIAFQTPRYRNTEITQSVMVKLQLVRPSDQETSAPLPFEYYPNPDAMSQQRRLDARKAVESVKRKFMNTDVIHQSPKQYKILTTPEGQTLQPPPIANYNGSVNSTSPVYVPEIKNENMVYDMNPHSCAPVSPYSNYNYQTSPSSCSTADGIPSVQPIAQILKVQALQEQPQQPRQDLNFTMSTNNVGSTWNMTTPTRFNGGSISIAPTNYIANEHWNFSSVQTPLNNNYNINNNVVYNAPATTLSNLGGSQSLEQQLPVALAQEEQFGQPPELSFSDIINDLFPPGSENAENLDTNALIQNVQQRFGNLDMKTTQPAHSNNH